ncbi:MAG: hypothetical protein PHQ40_15980 [Anaerolineaceae bacterium]|nr:hypothetical protein [Anaerolineaceae bacterium]
MLAGAGLLLAIAVIITAVGPERVLAAVRGLMGYIPGVGFVQDSETSRVPAAPVSLIDISSSLMSRK